MGILTWIIVGLVAGAVAKLVLPGDDPGGIIVTTLIGIAGAIVGGLIASALDIGGVSGFNIGSLLVAIGGAILPLLIYRMVVGRRSTRTV